jgi:hypothetical protein
MHPDWPCPAPKIGAGEIDDLLTAQFGHDHVKREARAISVVMWHGKLLPVHDCIDQNRALPSERGRDPVIDVCAIFPSRDAAMSARNRAMRSAVAATPDATNKRYRADAQWSFTGARYLSTIVMFPIRSRVGAPCEFGKQTERCREAIRA